MVVRSFTHRLQSGHPWPHFSTSASHALGSYSAYAWASAS